MKLLVLLCAALLSLGIAQAANAVTIQTTDGGHPWQAWANAAEVPTYAGSLPLTVASDYFDCGGFDQAAGCTSVTPAVDQTTGAILQGNATVSTEVDGGQGAWQDRQTLYHELGQVFWAEYLTPTDEAAFMRIVGIGTDVSQWGNWLYGKRTVHGVVINFAPFEWFAEGYRYCAEYGINQPPHVNDEEGVGYPGDRATFASQQRRVCQLIDRIGVDNGITTPAQAYPKPVVRRPVKVARSALRHRLSWGRRRVW